MNIQRKPIERGENIEGLIKQETGFQFDRATQQMSPNRVMPPQGSSRRRGDMAMTAIIDMIVKASIYLTVFMLPLFFLSKVSSVLELNKQAFLVVVVGIGFLAWVGKMAWLNEIRFRKNFILVPVVTFIAIFGLSTLFSNYSQQSLWGYFGGEGKSFITTLFLVAFFFLIINNIKSKAEAVNVVIAFLASGFLASFYGILQIWGKFILPGEATANKFFNTIGAVYIFAAYVGTLFLMALTLFLSNVSKILKIGLIILSFFFFFVLMVINFKIVWIALILTMAVLFGVTILRGGASNAQARVLPMVFLVLTLLMILRAQPIIKKELPTEILPNYKSSIKILLNSIGNNPMLGSGPATYSEDYKFSRPGKLGDFWAVNFNDGTSYFFTFASTMGILGILSLLFLVGAGLLYLFRTILKLVSMDRNGTGDYIAVGAGVVWLFATIIIFTYLTNITFLMVWWLSLSLFIAFSLIELEEVPEEFVTTSETPKSSLSLSFIFVLVIIGFVAAIYLQGQRYLAAVHFNKALVIDKQGGKIDDIVTQINKAVELDSDRDIYHRNLSVALFALANKRVGEKGTDLSPEDSNYVSNMIKGSLAAADRAIISNPHNSENYLALARVYEGVLVTMEKADEKAIENYEKAIGLDPNNPILHYKIANIYVALADVETKNAHTERRVVNDEIPEESLKNLALARENLANALKLKTDYVAANLLLAGVYEREGEMEKAIEKEKENQVMFPGKPGISFVLGLLYYRDEQFDNAKREFEGAVSLDKEYSNARYFLGLVLDRQENKEGALTQFRKVSQLNPDNTNVKKIISNLENGKAALDGLKQEGQTPDESYPSQIEGQPGISPDVEQQEIPQEATPQIDETGLPQE